MAILSSLFTGSFQTTGSFGKVFVSGPVSASEYTGVFKGALSSSAQISDDISGSFTAPSASISTRLTSVEGNVGGQGVNSSDSPTFAGLTTTGDVTVQGKLTAQELIVSSSVTTMSIAQASGSTIFGDGISDTHQFTGSILIGSGSISGSHESTGSFGKLVVSDDITADNYTGTFIGALSSSEQISDDISGSLGSNAAEIRTLNKASISGSLGPNAAEIRTLNKASISGSLSKDHLSSKVPNIVSSSVLSSGEQGTITLTTNGVAVNVDSGLQVGDSPTFVTTTLSGLDNNKLVRTDGSNVIGSADIEDFISGTSNQITVTNESNGTVTLSTPQDLHTSAKPTFGGLTSTGDVTVQGKLTAQELVVSSSVTTMSVAQASGSTVFGDDNSDTHHFTGSVFVTGSLNITHTGSFGRIEATTISSSTLNVDANSITIGGQTINEADAQVLNNTSGTNTGDVTLGGSGGYITISNQVITVDQIDISDDTNLTASTGITLDGDTISTNDSQIVHDDLSGFVGNEHIDHSTVSITAGNGLTGGGDITTNRTIDVVGGTGITANADNIAIDFGDSTFNTNVSGSWKGELSGSHVTLVGGGVSGSSVSSASFGELFISGSTRIGENLTVDGTLTAQEFVTEYLTETVIDVSGSTSFGNTVDDIHQFTGSILIGSGSISGSIKSTGSFGKLFGDGSDITNLPAAAINVYNNSGDNRIITSVDSNTVQGEDKLTFDGNGLTITGHVTASGNTSGSVTSTGSFGQIDTDTLLGIGGNVKYKAGTQTFQNAAGSKTMAVFRSANSVDLHYNNSKKFETTDTGVNITGAITASSIDIDSIQGNWTNAGNTIADLGTVTTVDINGGTITGITDLAVADGGTGTGTFTDGGILFGNGTSAIGVTAALTNGQLLIGDGSGAPSLGTLTGTSNQITVTNGAGSITLSLPQSIHTDADVEFDSITLDDLTASKLVGSDSNKKLVSIDLSDFVSGTADQITVTDDTDGTITLSTPQSINTTSNVQFNHITASGDISSSATITALQYGGNISGSVTSTGSFGRVTVPTAKNGVNIGAIPSNWTSELNILGTQSTTGIKIQAPSSGDAQIKLYSNNGGSNNDFWYIQATNGGTFDIVNYGPGSFTNMVSIAANTGNMTVRGNVSGSVTSTGSFGMLQTADDTHLGTKNYAISGSKISTGSFGRLQASFIGGNSAVVFDADNIRIDSSGNITPTAGADFSGSATSTISAGDFRSLNNTIFVDGSAKTFGIGKAAYGSVGTAGAWFSDLAGSGGFAQIAVNGSNPTLNLSQVGSGELIKGYDNTTLTFTLGQDGSIVSSAGATIGGTVQGTTIRTSNGGGPQLVNSTPNGTTPSIHPTLGDTNTGIGYGGANGSTADNINLITGGTTGLYIDSSQNVVIPAGNLSITDGNGLTLTNSSQLNYIKFKDSTDRAHLGFSNGSDDNFNIWIQENGHIQFATNNTYRMQISSTGNVGIGTATPNTPLHVYQGTVGDKIAVFQTVGSGHTQGIVIGSGTDGTDGQGLHIGYGQQIDSGYFDAYDWDAGAYQTLKLNNFLTVQGQTNVGIANSTPASFTNPYDTLVVGNNSVAGTGYGITIVTGGSATEGGIAFTDDTGSSRGRITYHQNHDKFLIGAGGNADQLQLNSNGNFGIGGAPSQKLTVHGSVNLSGGDLIIADSQVIKNTNDSLKLQPGSSRDILLLFGNGSTGVKLDRGGDLEVTNAVTASAGLFGNLNISSDASVTGNMVVGGTLTAQEFRTEFNTEVVIETSGSTKFGNSPDDKHQFTGSLLIGSSSISGSHQSTGSFGKLFGDGSDITGLTAPAITTYNSAADNRIITSVNSTTVQGESGLTYDGSALNITGNITSSTGALITKSGVQADVLTINSVTSGAGGGGVIKYITTSNSNTLGRLAFVDEGGYAAGFSIQTNKTGTNSDTTTEITRIDKNGNLKTTGYVSGSATSTSAFGKVGIGTNSTVGQADAVFYAYGHAHIRSNYQLVWGTNINSVSIRGHQSNNTLNFKVNTDHHLRWDSTGLGINTQSPDTKLEVAGAHVSGKGLVHIDSTDHAFIALDAANASSDAGIYFQENGTSQFIIDHDGSANVLRLHDGSTEFITISDSTGDLVTVGDISGSATSTATFGNYGGNISGSSTSTGSFGRVEIANRSKFDKAVGIGTEIGADTYTILQLDSNANTSGAARLRFSNNGTVVGSIYGGGSNFALMDNDDNWAYRIITDSTHQWYINNAEKMRLTSAGYLNIGIVSTGPDTPLHVSEGEVSGVGSNADAMVTFEREGSNLNENYVQFLTRTAGHSGLIFGDADSNDVARIQYKHDTDKMSIEHGGTIVSEFTTTMAISGSATSTGSFGKILGDGSEITGISTTPFPFTGSAGISGSLSIDRQAANSGSTIVEVKGTQGTLFSVVDEMSGSIFSANTVAGIPVIEAFSDGTVHIGPNVTDGTFGKLFVNDNQVAVGGGTGFPFTGSAGLSGSLEVKHLGAATGSTLLSVQGSEGTLFSVVNSMTGSIFSANTTAGIPVIEAFSDGDVEFGPLTTKLSGSNSLTASFGMLNIGTENYKNNFSSSIAGRVAAVQAAGSGITISNNANNRVLTGDGTNAVANTDLTWNGTRLTMDNYEITPGNTTTFNAGDEDITTVINGVGGASSGGSFTVGDGKSFFTSQNVGIGTASPSNTLHTYANVSSQYAALIENDQATSGHGLQVHSDGNGSGTILFDVDAAGSSRFRVKGDGSVLVGFTTSQAEKLAVNGDFRASGNIIAQGDIIAQRYIVSSSVTHMTQSFSSGSTIFGDTLKDTHQFTGSLNVKYSGSVGDDTAFSIEGNTGTLLNITDSQTGSLFNVNDISGVPIFDVDSNDTITMGQFSSPIRVLTDSNGNTMISGSSTSTAKFGQYVEASSIAFKTNVETLENPLDKISKLRGVTYNLKSNNEPSIGMIAEEVNEVFPELVDRDDSGNPQAMSYTRMTAVLLEAVKELTEEVKELKKANIYNKYKDKE